jgi:hypothetical protein
VSGFIKNPRSDKTGRLVIDNISGGWNTRAFPHLIGDSQLTVADNVIFSFDGLASKRPGNKYYGGGSGATGTGVPSTSGTRFYYGTNALDTPALVVVSDGKVFVGDDATGAFTQVGSGLASSGFCTFAQQYDPDASPAATELFICDGVHVPHIFDGTNFNPVKTGTGSSGTDTITTNPSLSGGGNLIASVNAAAAYATTVFSVSVISATECSVTDSAGNTASGAPSSEVTLDGVVVTLGAFGSADVGKTGSISITQSYNYLPNNPVTGSPITPQFCISWGFQMVYAGDPADPTGLYISDALRPERFTGYAMVDSAGSAYTPYYPGGRNASMGAITGLAVVGQVLVIFFQQGIIGCYNTGTYGAFQFQFYFISFATGCVAPRSIVSYDGYTLFFGGDRFYATDGQYIYALPDLVPTVYSSENQTLFPPEISNKALVVAARRGQQYLAAYPIAGSTATARIAVFDLAANGGWTPSYSATGSTAGGAWSRFPTGMPMAWGVECRGAGDYTFPFFWGSSMGDVVAQYDPGDSLFSDFGQPIACEVRSKSFLLDRPGWPKKPLGIVVLATYVADANFTSTVIPYAMLDQTIAPCAPVSVQIVSGGTVYGTSVYGSFLYGASNAIATKNALSHPPGPSSCSALGLGVTENSIYNFSVTGFVCEMVVDEPAP